MKTTKILSIKLLMEAVS